MNEGAPDLAVVVVTHNSERHLPGLLQTLAAGLVGVGYWRLVVADNASSDGTLECLARLSPDALVVRTGANRGYAAGINAALAAVGPTGAYLVLNPDIRLAPGAGLLLREAATGDIGVAVPRLTDEAGRLAFSLRREPTVVRAWAEALLGGRAGRFRLLGEVVLDPASYEHPTTGDWATGAALLVSGCCADSVGDWDESYFLYSEETDFLLRARDRGFRTTLVPQARAVHCGGDAHVQPALWSRLVVNKVRFFRTRHGRLASVGFWSAVLLGEALRSLRGNKTHRVACRALASQALRRVA